MRGKVARELRNVARLISEPNKKLMVHTMTGWKKIDGSMSHQFLGYTHKWEVGSYRHVYKGLKREYYHNIRGR